jgi:histidinol-phosphate aminotransferase
MEVNQKSNLARKGINQLKAYVPGKPVEEVKEEYGLTEIIKLASNENPFGTSPQAIEAIKQALLDTHFYPEGSSRLLRKKIAGNFNIDEEMVIVSNGADNIISIIVQALLNEGEEVITGETTFAAYESTTRIMGGIIIKVPLRNFHYDLSAIAERISGKTKLIFICNPNNPTGTMVTAAEVENFMKQVPDHCVVVFDEAYAEFVTAENYPRTIDYIQAGKNVLLVRTFSKIYGLAGLRVGYAVGPKFLIDIIRKVAEPFSTNRLAQTGALAALNDKEFVQMVLTENQKGQQYLCNEFSKLGLPYCPSFTNFIFVNLGMNAQLVFKKLLARGIIIRPGDIWNLPEYARITIGTADQNRKLVEALKNIINGK